jgi:hypothetical protein
MPECASKYTTKNLTLVAGASLIAWYQTSNNFQEPMTETAL